MNSPPVLQAHVPNVDFVSLNYVADMVRPPQEEDSRFNTRFEYEGPSPDVVRIANSVAQTGSILQINSPYPNATWTLEFEGPAISCAEVPESMQTDVRNRLKNTLFTPDTGCFVQGYMAWNDTDTGYPLPKNTSLSFSKLNKGGLALNVIGLPHMMDLVPGAVGGSGVIPYLEACYGSNGITHERFVDSTMIQCQLRNVTYQVLFEYQNGKQNISITTDTISEDPIRAISFVAGNGQTFPDNVINGVDCSVLSGVYDVDPGANPDNICLIDTKVLKTLSYQAIFQAFQELVIGSVTRASAATSANISTDVVNTILADTPNLAYLNPTLQSYSSLSTKPLQEYVQSGNVHLYKGLVNNAHTKSFDTLIPTMEKLFQDITVSMMSSRVLQYVTRTLLLSTLITICRPNLTSAFAPAPVQITLHNVHDVYVYSAARLWLAYGIAIFFAVMASVIGLRALFATGASYSQDFSTVLRIGRGALMSTEVKDGDTDGKDKLPKYLEEAQVWLRPANALAPTSKAEGVRSSDDISPNTQERVVGEGNRDL